MNSKEKSIRRVSWCGFFPRRIANRSHRSVIRTFAIFACVTAPTIHSFVPLAISNQNVLSTTTNIPNHGIHPSDMCSHQRINEKRRFQSLDTSRGYQNVDVDLAHNLDGELSPTSSFAKRMRQLALARQATAKTKERPSERRRPTEHKNKPLNVQTVSTLEHYKAVVADERDKLVVVRFYATWCKSCLAMAPYFYRLASSLPDVSFVEVPVTANNAALHQGLAVPSVPFGHIYHPSAGLVDEMKITKKNFSHFGNAVQSYVAGQCDCVNEDCSNPYAEQGDLEL